MALPRTHLIFFFSIFTLSLLTHFSSASNFISTNQSLSGNQNIVSTQGNFILGFYQPSNTSQRYYIAIWYKKIPIVTPVWVANRATPVSDPTTSVLQISKDGNLVLLNPSKDQVWSTNTNTTSTNTVAVLQDTGNLILQDGSKLLWQSFDHPTNTWLPGGKLSLNKVTGVAQRLISWKNSDDPAPGIFSLELDPDGSNQYIIQRNDTDTYWFSGYWDTNQKIFSGVPEMRSNFDYSFEYVNNATESYFEYTVKDENLLSRFIMDISGHIQQWTWFDNSQAWNLFWSQPRSQCEVYALCGAFGSCLGNDVPYCNCVKGFREKNQSDWDLGDQSSGCVRNMPLQCERNSSAPGKQDKFLPLMDMVLPVSAVSLQVGSDSECQSACLSNCSCTAYSTDSGCSVWYGDLINLSSGSGNTTLYLRLAASEFSSPTSKKGLVAGVLAGGGVGLVAFLAILWTLVWRRRRRRRITATKGVEGALVSFRYNDLLRATKNFSERLGGGGFGSVFKGNLPGSTPIAVKKLEGLSQGEKQFRAEVSTIGTIQHVNLVRLRGFCSEANNKLLVYDYMSKGSLDTQLFVHNSAALDWKTRYGITIGIARGLVYLHEKCRECIIHCDIKPENILLDDLFVPKVADFGLAKLVGRDFSRVLTTMRGTRGYLAPEWISGLPITAKADVYSYGMMLFEVISGRRNSENSEEGHTVFFPKLAATKLKEGDVISLLDYRLEGDANLEELTRACKVAIWCIQDDEAARPTMGQVVQILEGILEVPMPPIPMNLQLLGDYGENIVFFSDLSSKQSSADKSTSSTSTGEE